MQVKIIDDQYNITFPYDPEMVDFCRRLQRARWNPEKKCWTAVRNMPNALDLRQWGFVDDAVLHPTIEMTEGTHEWTVSATLYKHQDEWGVRATGLPRGLLAAEMGLGKTIMALVWLKHFKVNPENIIIVCPVSLIHHWVKEIATFTGETALAILGPTKKRLELLGTPGIHVVNYEFVTLNKTACDLARKKSCLILDESHKIKENKSKRSKVIHDVSRDKSHVLLLTGTPVSQGAQDYFSQMRAINPSLLGSSFTAFKNRYCVTEAIRGAPPGVTKIVDYKNLNELTRIIAPYTHTIRKKDCLDMPEKFYITRTVQLAPDQHEKYMELKHGMMTWLDSGEEVTAANILVRLLRFSQVTQGFLQSETTIERLSNPKLECLVDIIESSIGSPLVIMCRFREDIKIIEETLAKMKQPYGLLHGGVDTSDRHDIVDQFRARKFNILVAQIRVGGVGFNMEHCKTMVFYSNEYSLNDRLQAEDRIHRATSTKEPCMYIDIVAENTVDEGIISALQKKKNVSEMLSDLRKYFVAERI